MTKEDEKAILALTGALTDEALANTIDHLGMQQIELFASAEEGDDVTISEKQRRELFGVAIALHFEAARRLRILAS